MVNLESMVMNLSILDREILDREILDREIGRAKQESMAMIPRIFRVNLESMAMNTGIFSMENLESMVMNPGGKIGLIREDIGRAKQESMAMTRRIFRANLESMDMNPGIFSMENLESMAMNPGWKIGLIREDIGRAKQESMAMTRRIFRVNLESM